jgi:ATP phosphoribosyltransferase regulatory subunit
MLALGLEATAHYGIAEPEIRMGDVGLFAALVAALDLAPAWKRRLVKDFNRKTSLAHDLDVLTLSRADKRRSIRACWRRWPAPIRRPRMRWSPTCCRSPASHASAAARSARSPSASSNRRARRRDLAAARDARADREIPRHRRRSRRGRGELRALAAEPGSTRAALDLFESRTGFLAARGVDVARIRFSTAFGRGSTTTPASCSSCTIRRGAERAAGRRRPL